MTAKRAYDALSIAQKKEDELHLVLTESHLPDMDKYELLEKMKAVSKVPVVSKFSVSKTHSCYYFALTRKHFIHGVRPL